MPGVALRQPDLFDLTPSRAEYWKGRLEEAVRDAGVQPQSCVLPLADEALVECPDDCLILLLAAVAALLDNQPQRAMGLLKRFSKLGRSPGQHVLTALALAQIGQAASAKSLLDRHDLATWPAILRAFPGAGLPRLRRQFLDIIAPRRASSSPRRPVTARTAKQARPQAKPPVRKSQAADRVAAVGRLRAREAPPA